MGPSGSVEVVSNSQSPLAQAELDFIKKCWAPLGIQLEPKFIPDWSQFEQYLKTDSFQIYRYAWYADMPDPDSFLQPLFSRDSEANFMHYESDRVDQMLQSARGMVDPIERAKMYEVIQETIRESSPVIPLFYLSIDSVYQSNVQGVQVSALGAHTMPFYRVWLSPTKSQ
jgi:ABC-type transport system substrate-binding protein